MVKFVNKVYIIVNYKSYQCFQGSHTALNQDRNFLNEERGYKIQDESFDI